jgi:3-hydroxyacyl-CoA dehydrogenase, NAD binding domain
MRSNRHSKAIRPPLIPDFHHVHITWHQNFRYHWRWSDGYAFLVNLLRFVSQLNFLGLGIAYVAALRAKVPVKLYDRSSEQISKGLNLMDKLLAKDVAKGKIQEGDARQARERVSVVDQAVGVRALRDVDMVIEVRPKFQASQLAEHTLSRLSRRTFKSNNAYSQN